MISKVIKINFTIPLSQVSGLINNYTSLYQ